MGTSGIKPGWAITPVIVGFVLFFCYHPSTTLRADGDPDWNETVNSRDMNKPTVLFFTATWCPSCQTLRGDVLSRGEVQDYIYHHYNFHTVELTAAGGSRRASQFHVHAFPTLIRYDRDGKETARSHGGSAEEVVAWLRDGE